MRGPAALLAQLAPFAARLAPFVRLAPTAACAQPAGGKKIPDLGKVWPR